MGWTEATTATASTSMSRSSRTSRRTSTESINFVLGTLFYILFAGVTFVLLGLAVAWSRVYPRWLGWMAMVAGAGSVVVGLMQAQVGETNAATRILSIIFPTVITLWLVWMGVLLLRKAPALERTPLGRPLPRQPPTGPNCDSPTSHDMHALAQASRWPSDPA